MKLKRDYKTQEIPDEWIIKTIQEGNRTTNSIIESLGISNTAAYYKLRKMTAEGRIKRDETRRPFFYYVKEEVTNEGYGSHKK